MKKQSTALVILLCGMYLFAQSLFDLVKMGTPEQVQAAIKSGAQVNDSDTLGQTPLMHGAECNENSDVITTLLNAGADAKAKSIEGKTAFDYAQNNPTIKGTKAYWELNNARFQLEGS